MGAPIHQVLENFFWVSQIYGPLDQIEWLPSFLQPLNCFPPVHHFFNLRHTAALRPSPNMRPVGATACRLVVPTSPQPPPAFPTIPLSPPPMYSVSIHRLPDPHHQSFKLVPTLSPPHSPWSPRSTAPSYLALRGKQKKCLAQYFFSKCLIFSKRDEK